MSAYLNETGADAEDVEEAEELPDSALLTLRFHVENPTDGIKTVSFREELDRLIAEGHEKFPCPFASTEY